MTIKNSLAEITVPDGYPVSLLELIHSRKNIRVDAQHMISWQLCAQLAERGLADMEGQRAVYGQLGREIADKVTVYQSQMNKEGRLYHATLYAMSGHEFLELMYEAYQAGASDVRRAMPVQAPAQDMTKPCSQDEWAAGRSAAKTCERCGLFGPCTGAKGGAA